MLLIWSCIFYTSYQCHVWIHILSVLIFLLLLVSMFHFLSKTLILLFLMQKFPPFSGLSCLPFFCQHSASCLVSLWNSQELQFSRNSPEVLQWLTYSLLFPPEVTKCFIKMQEPCKNWKRVGQDIQLSIHVKTGMFHIGFTETWQSGSTFRKVSGSGHSSCLCSDHEHESPFPRTVENALWSFCF